ncbi:MAG TPA: DUF5684 domain-containing protein [Pirellulaceae bacterium]|nr:DUF5684 domain-containing protein [Pirellulaceae bacterium]
MENELDPDAAAVAAGMSAIPCCCGIGALVVWALFVFYQVACLWVIFEKAGKPGWAAIVPIYNAIVLAEVVRKEVWWGIMLLIPVVNIVFAILILIELAKVFGKDTGFAIGLILLGPVFMGILAFGKATYQPAGFPQGMYAMPPQRPMGGGGWGQPPKR